MFTRDRERGRERERERDRAIERERGREERKEGGRGERGEVNIIGRRETLLINHSREIIQFPHWHYANSTSGSKSHLDNYNVMIWVID